MKVGLIGLGRMGEGMSRRMMKEGIEVWGYRRNYDKAQEAYEKDMLLVSPLTLKSCKGSSTSRWTCWKMSWHLSTCYSRRISRGHAE